MKVFILIFLFELLFVFLIVNEYDRKITNLFFNSIKDLVFFLFKYFFVFFFGFVFKDNIFFFMSDLIGRKKGLFLEGGVGFFF